MRRCLPAAACQQQQQCARDGAEMQGLVYAHRYSTCKSLYVLGTKKEDLLPLPVHSAGIYFPYCRMPGQYDRHSYFKRHCATRNHSKVSAQTLLRDHVRVWAHRRLQRTHVRQVRSSLGRRVSYVSGHRSPGSAWRQAATTATKVAAQIGGSGALLWQQAWEDCRVEVLSSRVMLCPADLDRSRRCYRDVLGLAVYREFGAADPGCPRRARPPGRSRGPRRPGANAGAVGPGRDVDRGSRRRLNRAGGGLR
jgi:hypothetical protein